MDPKVDAGADNLELVGRSRGDGIGTETGGGGGRFSWLGVGLGLGLSGKWRTTVPVTEERGAPSGPCGESNSEGAGVAGEANASGVAAGETKCDGKIGPNTRPKELEVRGASMSHRCSLPHSDVLGHCRVVSLNSRFTTRLAVHEVWLSVCSINDF